VEIALRDTISRIMHDVLFDLLREKVYKTEQIREVSYNSTGKTKSWIFDFKSQTLSKVFLEEFARRFWSEFKNMSDGKIQIAGMETGAIPLLICLTLFASTESSVQTFYIRKSRKKHDLANVIEGTIDPTVPIILVDDILNSGGTMRKLIATLEERGCKISTVFVCLRFRDLSAYQDLVDKGIRIVSLFELNDFKDVLPVQNLETEPGPILTGIYAQTYKVRLTDKPNLYSVVPKSGPVLVDQYIYMGVDDGTFYCLNKDDGSVVWTYTVPFGTQGKRIFSTPTVFRDRVLFGAYDGNFYCFDRLTGKRIWVFTDADWIGSSPCVDTDAGIAFVGLEFGLFGKQGGLVAVDIATGKALWKEYTMKGYTHASPSFNKKHGIVVCGCNDGYMYAFRAKTGAVLWKFKTKGEVKYGAAFDDSRNVVLFGSMDGGLYVVHIKTGELYHTFQARFGFYATPAVSGNRVIIGSLDKTVYCFNLSTKATEWSFETNGRIFASPLVENNSVFIGSNDGRLYEIDISSGKLIALVQLTERVVNRIQVEHMKDGKRVLYIPTHVGELYKMVETERPSH
jgi:outer membrane protein assembly factor BamB/orotate phosphoribosyltransferase